MYTPEQWNAVVGPAVTWRDAYALVEEQARLHFRKLGAECLSTGAVVEALYPELAARGEVGVKARARIFKALAALAERGLVDCATRGELRLNGMGRNVRPWLWHAPDPNVKRVCPACGKPK